MNEDEIRNLYSSWLAHPELHLVDGENLYKCKTTCDTCPFSSATQNKTTCIERETYLYDWMLENHLHPELFI